MAKRDKHFPDGHKVVVCSRCGAPGNAARRGGRLVPITGLQVGTRGAGRRHLHRLKLYQHADPAFCRLRLPHRERRSPVDRSPRP